MELCKINTSLSWQICAFFFAFGHRFLKGPDWCSDPQTGVCRGTKLEKMVHGTTLFSQCLQWQAAWSAEKFRAVSGLKKWCARRRLSVSPLVLQGGKLQRTMLPLVWLLMVVRLSFPRLEFEVQVSALTLSSPLLCLRKCRSVPGWLDPELYFRIDLPHLFKFTFLIRMWFVFFFFAAVELLCIYVYIHKWSFSGCFLQTSVVLILVTFECRIHVFALHFSCYGDVDRG